MTEVHLAEALGITGIPQVDLEVLLHWRFSNGRIDPTEPLSIVYSRQEGDALKVTYDKRGNLVELIPLAHWTEDDYEGLRDEIAAERGGDGKTRIRRAWAFASVPMVGSWRYRDVFQVCEPPTHAPAPTQLVGDHPLVLEVAFADSDHRILGLDRSLTATRRIELLLNVLLRFDVHQLHPGAGWAWTYVTTSSEPLTLSTEFRQIGYTVDGFDATTADFSPSTSPVRTVPLSQYLAERGIRSDETVSVPEELTALLDAFFYMAPAEQERFLRACFWFQHASQVWHQSVSSSFTALIQAIETLLRPPQTEGHCPTCNRGIGPGPTARFINFVEEHAPGLPRTDRKRLYQVRSDLTHGNFLLKHDEYRGFGAHFTPLQMGQRADLDQAHLVARVAMVGWLINKGRDKS